MSRIGSGTYGAVPAAGIVGVSFLRTSGMAKVLGEPDRALSGIPNAATRPWFARIRSRRSAIARDAALDNFVGKDPKSRRCHPRCWSISSSTRSTLLLMSCAGASCGMSKAKNTACWRIKPLGGPDEAVLARAKSISTSPCTGTSISMRWPGTRHGWLRSKIPRFGSLRTSTSISLSVADMASRRSSGADNLYFSTRYRSRSVADVFRNRLASI